MPSCEQAKTETEEQQKNYTIDTSVVAILPYETTKFLFSKDCKKTDLTNSDLLKIETILNECINNYNLEQEKTYKEINEKRQEDKPDKVDFIIDLTRYKRQYMVVLNSKGEKEILINCFCDHGGMNWKRDLYFVDDGGNCYFTLKMNLTTGRYYELMVNGYA